MTDLRNIIADWRENGTPGPWSGNNLDLVNRRLHQRIGPAIIKNGITYEDASLMLAAPAMAARIEALEAVCADLLGIARAAVSERAMSANEYRQALVMVFDTLRTALQENTDGD